MDLGLYTSILLGVALSIYICLLSFCVLPNNLQRSRSTTGLSFGYSLRPHFKIRILCWASHSQLSVTSFQQKDSNNGHRRVKDVIRSKTAKNGTEDPTYTSIILRNFTNETLLRGKNKRSNKRNNSVALNRVCKLETTCNKILTYTILYYLIIFKRSLAQTRLDCLVIQQQTYCRRIF